MAKVFLFILNCLKIVNKVDFLLEFMICNLYFIDWMDHC